MLESSGATAGIHFMNLRIKNKSAEQDLKIEPHLSEFILVWRALQIDLGSDKLGYEIKALNLTGFFLPLPPKKKQCKAKELWNLFLSAVFSANFSLNVSHGIWSFLADGLSWKGGSCVCGIS